MTNADKLHRRRMLGLTTGRAIPNTRFTFGISKLTQSGKPELQTQSHSLLLQSGGGTQGGAGWPFGGDIGMSAPNISFVGALSLCTPNFTPKRNETCRPWEKTQLALPPQLPGIVNTTNKMPLYFQLMLRVVLAKYTQMNFTKEKDTIRSLNVQHQWRPPTFSAGSHFVSSFRPLVSFAFLASVVCNLFEVVRGGDVPSHNIVLEHFSHFALLDAWPKMHKQLLESKSECKRTLPFGSRLRLLNQWL